MVPQVGKNHSIAACKQVRDGQPIVVRPEKAVQNQQRRSFSDGPVKQLAHDPKRFKSARINYLVRRGRAFLAPT